jgi:hypothetical protein
MAVTLCCQSLDIKSNIVAVMNGVHHMTSNSIYSFGRNIGIFV